MCKHKGKPHKQRWIAAFSLPFLATPINLPGNVGRANSVDPLATRASRAAQTNRAPEIISLIDQMRAARRAGALSDELKAQGRSALSSLSGQGLDPTDEAALGDQIRHLLG